MSGEPSMEEILSSIKRIIAEEGEGPIRGRRVGRAVPRPGFEEDEAEVLELSHPIGGPSSAAVQPALPPAQPASSPAPSASFPGNDPLSEVAPEPAAEKRVARPATAPAAEPTTPSSVVSPMSDPEPADPILSTQAAAASRSALDSLSRLMVKPEPSSDGTLEGMVREMLRPMLRDWLDANLPSMVETMVQAEIKRISNQPR